MNIRVLYFILTVLVFSCKKNTTTQQPATPTPTPGPQFTLNFQKEFGNGYQYSNIGNNPVTLYPDGSSLISTISYDGATDVVQLDKLDVSGNLVWEKKFKYSNYWHQSGNALLTSDGNILQVGSVQQGFDWTSSKVLALKLNQNGDTLWHRLYGHNYVDIGQGAVEDAGNTYWLVDFSAQNFKFTLIKLDNNGDSLTSVINQESYSVDYKDYIVTSANEVVVAGSSGNFISGKQPVYISKYLNGLKIFSANFALTNYDEVYIKGITESYDGNYIIYGGCKNFSQTPRHAFIMKVDKNGSFISEKILTNNNDIEITCANEYLANTYFVSVIGNGIQPGLYKLDSNLNLVSTIKNSIWSVNQLILKGSTVFCASFGSNASFYEVVILSKFSF